MIYLKSKISFYGYNQNGSLNKKIGQTTIWAYLGVENGKHKLQRIFKYSDRVSYAFVSKNQIKNNFSVINENQIEKG